ncbi:DUF3311 domain-containing protein [Achromobacter aloeverae]
MRAVHTLALVPVLMVLVGPFFLNRVTPFLLGMPFLLSWLALSLVLTSIVMAIIYYSDRKVEATRQDGYAK